MELAGIAAIKIIQMFVMVAIGAIASRVGLITTETNGKLSNISLKLVSPLLIFMSYQKDFDPLLLRNLMISFGLAVLMYVVQIGLPYVFIRRKNNPDYDVEIIACVYSNAGFMGIPLIYGLFGSEGVFYVTAFLSVLNLLCWTHGVIVMTGKSSLKQAAKNLCTPCIFAVVIGLACFLARIRVPELVAEPISSIADMNTPLAMLISGAKLAETNLKKAVTNPRIYYVCFVKLLVIPMAAAVVLSFFHLPDILVMVQLVLVACPSAAIGTMFAIMYNRNSLYASEMFALSTLSSLVTLPVVVIFARLIGVGM